MIRYILLLLFLIMFAGGPFGLEISVAPGLSTKNVFLYLLFTALAIETVVTQNRQLQALPVLVPFSLLLAYCIFSFLTVVFIVDYPDYDVLAGAVTLKSNLIDTFLILLLFFYGVTTAKEAVWLIHRIIWIVMLGNILTLAHGFEMPGFEALDLSIDRDGRLQGFIGQSAQYGAFLSFFLPAALALFFSRRGIMRVAAGVGVLATFLCLLLAFSRGSYVGTVAGAIFACFFLRHHISMRTVAIASIVGVFACAAAVPVMFAVGYGDLLIERLSLVEGDAHTLSQGRTTIWWRALSIMMESPVTFITGYGWNAYGSFREFRLVTHNVYLNHLFNIGTVGLTLFLAIISSVFATTRNAINGLSGEARSFAVSAIFGFFALCVSMFFVEVYMAGILIWAFIGLILRIAVDAHSENTQLENRADSSDVSGAA